MHARLVVPTDDLFAWTLTGRESLLTHPDADPRTAQSRERFALGHLLGTGHHVTALGHTVIGNLLGALADAGSNSPPVADTPMLTRVEENWDASADRRRSLVGAQGVPDEACALLAVRALLAAVPAATLDALLPWAQENWRAHRAAWPTHLVHHPDGAGGSGGRGRFGANAFLLRVTTPDTVLTGAQREVVRACQDAGLDVLHLRVNSFGAVPCPTDLGLASSEPVCPSCPAPVSVQPPAHLLPGEWPLPPFLRPGVREERHDHHLREHLAATALTVSDAVAALEPEALDRQAFALLTHPDTARDSHRARLERATRRHRDLLGDPHLAHEQAQQAQRFRAALTTWRTHADDRNPTTRRVALREAAAAAGTHLALHGHDVSTLRGATGAVNQILAAPRSAQDAPALFRLLSLGITGEELLQMDAAGTYPDPDTLELLAALRS